MSMRVLPVSSGSLFQAQKMRFEHSPVKKAASRIISRARAFLGGIGGQMIIGFLLGRALLLGEIFPFALPYITLISQTSPVAGLWTGLAAGAGIYSRTGTTGLLLFSLQLLISLILAVAARKLFAKSPPSYTAPVIAAFASLLPKILYLILNRFYTAYDLTAIAIESIVILVVTVLFSRVLLEENSAVDAGAVFVILGGLLVGLEGLQVVGLSLLGVVIPYIIMVLALASGHMASCTGGTVAGLVASLSTNGEPAVAGIYALLGLLSGLFREGKKTAIIISYILGLTFVVTATKSSMLGLSLREGLLAALIFLLTPRSIIASGYNLINQFAPGKPKQTTSPIRIVEDKLKKAAALLNSMSQVLSQDIDPGVPLFSGDIDSLVSELAQQVCQDCSMCEECWVRRFYRTYKGMVDLFTVSELTGETIKDQAIGPVPGCRRQEELVNGAIRLISQYRGQFLLDQKISESRETVSWQLSGLSEILTGLAEDLGDMPVIDEKSEAEIEAHLKAIGITPEDVTVTRDDNSVEVVIMAHACDGHSECELTVVPAVSNYLKTPMAVINRHCPQSGGRFCTFSLAPEREYALEIGTARMTKTGCDLCGDNYLCEEVRPGRYLLALCDGMGSGSQAYTESTNALTLLRELLALGMDRETAVNTLNSFLLLRSGREAFSTMDICLVDLFSGLTELIKIGAPASYLMRKGQIEVIKSQCPPVGIVEELEVETVSRVLQDGDCLVMVTDGLFEAQRDLAAYDEWMTRALRQVQDADPEDIANYLINRAKNNISGSIIDDMAVVCARIHYRGAAQKSS